MLLDMHGVFLRMTDSELGGPLDTSEGQPTGLGNRSTEMVASEEELFGETFFQKLFTSFLLDVSPRQHHCSCCLHRPS